MMSQKTFFYTENKQTRNLGDVLINKALVALMREEGELCILKNPQADEFSQAVGIKEEERTGASSFYWKMIFIAIRGWFAKKETRYQVYIMGTPGGGGIVMRAGFLRSGAKLLAAAFFRLIGIRVCGFGYSMHRTSLARAFFEYAYWNLAFFSCTRDLYSLTLLRDLGVRNIGKMPDLALYYGNEFQAESGRFTRDPRKIVISLRNCNDSDYPNYLQQVRGQVLGLLNSLGSGYQVVFSYQVDEDLETAQHLLEDFSDFGARLLDEKLDLHRAYELYGSAEIVITNRLHVMLLAAMSGGDAGGRGCLAVEPESGGLC
jgi:polysaccharide pyruvyl transferase WcaK-like protein